MVSHPLIRLAVASAAIRLAVTAIAVGGGCFAVYWWMHDDVPPHYLTAGISRGDIQRSVTMTGTINPVITVQVGSYVSGIVKWLGCDFNTEVKAGQICARIDPQPFQEAVDEDRADMQTAEAQTKKDQAALVYAKQNYERDAKLFKQGVVSQDQVDIDKSSLDQAAAQVALDNATVQSRKAALKAAEVNLSYTDIISPVDGMVITRDIDVGQTVVSSLQSSTLFLIGKDMTKMQVDTNVSESDISTVKIGQPAVFTVQAFPDEEFHGVVREIRQAPITVQNVVTYDVVLAVDNPDRRLFPGMTADTHIILGEHKDVLRVPQKALHYVPSRFAHGDRDHGEGHKQDHQAGERPSRSPRVWVLRDGQIKPVKVTVGLDDGDFVEVEGEGLSADDKVIVGEARKDGERRSLPANRQSSWRPGPRF